jgi:glucans biosynthesis protein
MTETHMMVMATPGAKRKFEINPMKNYATRPGYLNQRPRCGARTRAGPPCRRPPVRGRKRCRLHGGLSPGAPRGLKNGNFKTGDWTSEAITERKWLRSLVHSFAKSGTTE